MEDVRPKTLGYPNFSFQVKEMMDLLSPVAVEADQKGKKLTALINPDAKVVFSAENIVSQRFQNVLRAIELNDKEDKRPVDQATNKTLLFYTLSILTALYYNLSQLTSPLYQRKPKFLYRTSEDSSDEKPNYTAPHPRRRGRGVGSQGFRFRRARESPPRAGRAGDSFLCDLDFRQDDDHTVLGLEASFQHSTPGARSLFHGPADLSV
jgi:hypothetical protein